MSKDKFEFGSDPWMFREYSKAMGEAIDEIERLKGMLRDVLTYCPDYIHGEPKKIYERAAMSEEARLEEVAKLIKKADIAWKNAT